MTSYKAVAAMSLNRVIGAANSIPWHLPEDFKWFKRLTLGHTLLMGRKTFESIGRPLPGRATCVLSRSNVSIPGVHVIGSLSELAKIELPGEIFICGGEQIYRLALPLCDELFLTLVKKQVEGDSYFPPFEEEFSLVATMEENDRFAIRHYHRILNGTTN